MSGLFGALRNWLAFAAIVAWVIGLGVALTRGELRTIFELLAAGALFWAASEVCEIKTIVRAALDEDFRRAKRAEAAEGSDEPPTP